jgi:hypothetical protein
VRELVSGYKNQLASPQRLRRLVSSHTYGTQGTPALNIISLLSLLLPIALIASGGGPINTIPASFTFRAKSVDSDMNPYPG